VVYFVHHVYGFIFCCIHNMCLSVESENENNQSHATRIHEATTTAKSEKYMVRRKLHLSEENWRFALPKTRALSIFDVVFIVTLLLLYLPLPTRFQ
jgi:hypothetical protein